jgi:hypothetical protein
MESNRRAQERERAAAQAPADATRAEAERKAVADAQKVVAIWMRAGQRAGALVLPDDWRRHRGGATVAHILLPGLRTVRLG